MSVTTGRQGQFTYDFGIAIAQGTVNKIARLAGITLTLAAAYNSLMGYAEKYVNTLKTTATQFGGFTRTIQVMEQAQNRLLSGQSKFSVDDQMHGMKQLMAMGVDVEQHLGFIDKAAHATGQSLDRKSVE